MPSAGGMRTVQDERQILSDLGKLFHVVKANHRERQQQKKAAAKENNKDDGGSAKDATAARKQVQKKNKKASSKLVRGSRRRSKTGGGSIWIVLKGGFANSAVPTASDTKKIAQRAAIRAERSMKLRVIALELAEAYIESAWQQADEAGLLTDELQGGAVKVKRSQKSGDGSSSMSKTPTAEGVQYLCEQYDIAARMLEPPAAGAQLRKVVETHCTSSAGGGVGAAASSSSSKAAAAAAVVSSALPSVCDGGVYRPPAVRERAFSKSEWEGIATREAEIRYRFRSPSAAEAGSDAAAEHILAVAEKAGEDYYFPIAEPLATASSSGASAAKSDGEAKTDILPTKCIVRIRNSQRQKQTALLSNAKAVNYFKANFMQVLKRELAGTNWPSTHAITSSSGAEGKAKKWKEQR